jgi:hypothetical protein
LFSSFSFAQSTLIGKVVDKQNKPLPFIRTIVFQANDTIATTTNEEGVFNVFCAPGFTTVVVYSDERRLNQTIELQIGENKLAEVFRFDFTSIDVVIKDGSDKNVLEKLKKGEQTQEPIEETNEEYKILKGLKKENLRDNMTNTELILNMLAEASVKDISQSVNPETFEENKIVAAQGGNVANVARKELEAKTGKKVITATNAKVLLNSKNNDTN